MSVIGHGVEIVPSALQLPSSPVEGSLVYQLDINSVLFWDGSNWITLNNPVEGTPIGSLIDYSGTTAPTGWLLANGDIVPNGNGTIQGITANFSALYNIVGTTYGAAGTLPDFRGRVSAGKDDMGGITASRITSAVSGITGTTLGATGGNQAMQEHTHTFSGTTGNDSPDHSHTFAIHGGTFGDGAGAASLYNGFAIRGYRATGGANSRHQHAYSGTTANHNKTQGSSGNIPPTIIVNKIIRYLA